MSFDSLIPHTVIRIAREYTRKLGVRVVIMGFMAFVALGLTHVIETRIPKEIGTSLTGGAADRLLQIIANAMLAVTTFSLSVMVSVYQSSSTQWTPRVHRLIIQDRSTQNTLAIFIGAYVYALVAIVMRELGVFQDERALVLFVMTVLVMAVIVIYLIRWVLHLQTFGSLIDTTRQIEDVARKELKERLANPCLGAVPLVNEVPSDAEAILARDSGYVQAMFPKALNTLAKSHGVELYLINPVGKFVFENEPLVMFRKTATPEDDSHDQASLEESVRNNIRFGDLRTYDQDPRFGLLVMGEVGSKALSPGVNDPGTAIDVITRLGRLLALYSDEVAQDCDSRLENIHVPPLEPDDLIDDAFGAIARDGVDVVEVQQRLQVVLSGVMEHPDKGLSKAARQAAELHLRRAVQAVAFAPDGERLLSSARADVKEAVRQDDVGQNPVPSS